MWWKEDSERLSDRRVVDTRAAREVCLQVANLSGLRSDDLFSHVNKGENIMAITGLDHVVIRVKDIDVGIESYRKLGLELTQTLETPAIGKQAIFRMPNGTFIELVAPLSPESAVGRAIESRGEGVHSVVLAVNDFEKSVEGMKQSGAKVIQTEDLQNMAFVHPKSTHGVLLQVQLEKPAGHE
jgi:methylmalonyl-CoA/ethylmalonyl-CoA epimerase